MLNRLKAAWRLLLAKQYVVMTIDNKTGNGKWIYSCKPAELEAFGALCLSEAREVVESRQMNSLVSEAQAILEKKG